MQRKAEQVQAQVDRDLAYFTLIADLTTLRHRCRFALGPGGELAARYLDLPFAAVAFYGQGAGLRAALAQLLAEGEPCYVLLGETQRAHLRAAVRILSEDAEWQMVYRGEPGMLHTHGAVSLGAADFPAMCALAERGGLHAFEGNALEKGPFAGVWADGRLVSMAGTHLQLDHAAEIGNVVTDPAYRRRGLASVAVGAVIKKLCTYETVFLQVFKTNPGAVACYEKLGFERLRTMYLVRFVL